MAFIKALTPTPIQRSGLFVSIHTAGRRAGLCLAIAALLLSACAPAGTAAPTAQPTVDVNSIPLPAPTSAPTLAPEPTATVPAAPTAAPSGPISLVDGMGRTVTLDGPAQRIISLTPVDTEILFAIGAGSQVLGVDQYSDYPEAVKQLKVVGTGVDKPDTELILSLKPDLILATGIVPVEKVKALEDLGLKVFTVATPTNFDGMYDSLRTVAKLSGHTPETETLIASLQKRVKAVTDKVGTPATQPLVFYELDGSDPSAPWTSGPGTFMDNLIRAAGGRNLGADLKADWVQISSEEIIRLNPDFILLGDFTFGGMTPDMVKARSGWSGITAVKQNQVFTIDDNIVSRPGPRLVDGLETIAKTLHPDLFK
jgi:iron complex transport system substrate-binding protein